MARNASNKGQTPGSVPINWVNKYVGIPFADRGRDFSGCDCWGLVWLAYKHVLDIELPSYCEISAKDLLSVAKYIGVNYEIEPWIPVDNPRSFDVAVMRFHGSRIIGHVGLLVGPGIILHTEKATDSATVPVTHMSIRHRLVGYRRHASFI